MKIGILAGEETWHFQDLRRAVQGLNRCTVESVAFESLGGRINSSVDPATCFHCGPVEMSALDALVVRTMPGGSLQQVVFRMDLLNRLQAAGVTVVNPPRAMEISVDKYLSLAIVAENGIAVPETRVAQSVECAMDDFAALGRDVVYKPIFGSMGNGIERLIDRGIAEQVFAREILAGQVIYQQRFVDHGESDLRLLVIGDDVLGMRRTRRGHWLTNIAQGAVGDVFTPNARQVEIARAACVAVGCRIAGVDLLVDRRGQHWVVDVNAAPGWKALSAAAGVDVGRMIIEEVIRTARS